MGRKNTTQTDTLTLEPDGQGYRLFGYINGKQVRRQGSNLAEMETLKRNLELQALQARAAFSASHPLPESWITIPQLREAESAFQLLNGRTLSLVECVQHGLKTLGDGGPFLVADAQKEYIAHLGERNLSLRHCGNTNRRLRAFFGFAPAKLVGEIDARDIERFCFRPGMAGFTKLSDAIVIQAFLGYCVKRKWLRVSPFGLDMRELKKHAHKGRARPTLLSPDSARKLLEAACELDGGSHVPYLVLSLWSGIRRAEVEKITLADIRFGTDKSFVLIHSDVSKTASHRKAYIPENMVPLLKECVERGLLGVAPIGAPNWTIWAKIRAKAGLVSATLQSCGHTRVKNLAWQGNILRHTALSYYYQLTGDISETARQAGHSTEMSFRHYINLSHEGDAKRFYSITASLTPMGQTPHITAA